MLIPDYAALAAGSCFQAFSHHFLPEMLALSGVESLRSLTNKRFLSHQTEKRIFLQVWDSSNYQAQI
jgi:hypothetical protein